MECPVPSESNSNGWILVQPKAKHSLRCNHSVIPPSSSVIAKGDSAASNHYFALRDASVLDAVHPDPIGTSVILPDKSSLTSVASGHLPLPTEFTPASTRTEIFDNLQSSLVSLGQLCDDNCTVVLTKGTLCAIKNDKIVLTGHRSTSGDGLWDIPIPQHSSPVAPSPIPSPALNVIIRKDTATRDLIRYLHAACFSPPIKTFLQALQRNQLITWPGLTSKLVTKYLTPTIATAKGHLNQERQGLQSTNPSPSFTPEDMLPTISPKSREVIYSLVSSKDTSYMDLTGRFPFCSSRGNEYILIGYNYDANAILGAPLKNRQAATITKVWNILHHQCSSAGVSSSTWILDNESSQDLISAMKKRKVSHQLVPPHNHRANAAERAIQTFKSHFKAGLASLDPSFPIAEWDRLLPQAFLTLNLLRTSRVNPNLSAYAVMNGQFDFGATPLAPPGTKVLVHHKPSHRHSWDPHGQEGFYIGPSLHHYRCVKCFIPSSRAEVNSDTVAFFPHDIPFPEVKIDDFLRQAATDIITILTHPPPTTVPSLQAGDSTKNAILELASILNRADNISTRLEEQRKVSLTAARQLRPSPSSAPSPKVATPTTPFSTPRSLPASSVPKPQPQPTLSPVQSQRLKTILTSFFTALSQKIPFSAPTRPSQVPQSHSYKHRAATALLAHHIFTPHHHVNHIYNSSGVKQNLRTLLKGNDKLIWLRSLSNEFGRLAQGNDFNVKGTDTIEFISPHEVPRSTCDICQLRL